MNLTFIVSGLRLSCLAGLVYSLSPSWMTLGWGLALAVSIFLIKPNYKKPIRLIHEVDPLKSNPLRGKPKITEDDITADVKVKIHRDIVRVMCYDPLDVDSLHNFEQIKQNSQCVFAKRAQLWGSRKWNDALSLEENIYRCVPTLIRFSHVCEPLGLDGFLVEVPGARYASDLKTFGETTRRVLTLLSDNDPAEYHCMNKSYIDRIGWVFEFNRVTCFVTTFAPFYPETNSRYGYECQNGYILLQPEISFAQHDIPSDTPETQWTQPRTVRDRIRVAFQEAGMPYKIRPTVRYPMVHDIVKPLDDNLDSDIVEWWKKHKQTDDQKGILETNSATMHRSYTEKKNT